MQEERKALVGRAFPDLRALAERGNRGLQEVDLRWGVTPDEAETGEVLDICLDEIDACRPFFIVILGDRYGQPAPTAQERLARRHPHLLPYADRSLTELEVRHAVLNPPAHSAPCNAHVYVRASALEKLADTSEAASIAALVAELGARGPIRVYKDPVELADFVRADLGADIEAALPYSADTPAQIDQSAFRSLHRATGFQRWHTLLRLSLARRLRRRVVLEGEAGSGKSSLLVASYDNLAQAGRGTPLPVLLSLTAAGGSWPQALSTLGGHDGDSFYRFETLVAGYRGTIMIDGVDAARSDTFGDGLDWVPRCKPAGSLVVATRSPQAAAALAAVGFLRLRIGAMSKREQLAVLRGVLAAFGKVLRPDQEERILRHPATRRPDYLRLVCEELRSFGLFEELEHEINRLLAIPDVVGLFDATLARLEGLEGVPAAFPGRALKLLLAARGGLTEDELLKVLGEPTAPAVMRSWSPIKQALRPFLLDRAGVISIESEALRDAVKRRYGGEPSCLTAERALLTDFFLSDPIRGRAIDELMFLLPAAERWTTARALLLDQSWLAAARARDPTALEAFFVLALQQLEAADAKAMVAQLTKSGSVDGEGTLVTIELLIAAGRLGDAAEFAATAAAKISEPIGDEVRHRLLELRAEALARSGKLGEALVALDTLRAQSVDERRTAGIKDRAGQLALDFGETAIARRLFSEARDVYFRTRNEAALRRSLANLATVDLADNRPRKARTAFAALVRQARRAQDFDLLALSLGGEGVAQRMLGHSSRALALNSEEAALWRRRGDYSALARCHVNQALCLLDRDDLSGADNRLDEAFAFACAGGDRRLALQIRRRQIALLERTPLRGGARVAMLEREATSLAQTLAAPDS